MEMAACTKYSSFRVTAAASVKLSIHVMACSQFLESVVAVAEVYNETVLLSAYPHFGGSRRLN